MLTAKRACNLKDSLVHSEFQKTKEKTWLTDNVPIKGMHPCGHCHICRYVLKSDSFDNAGGTTQFKINEFINCSTERVIYELICPCGMIYIGKTKRKLKIRIGEHLTSIRKKEDDRPVALHFLNFHQANPAGLKVRGIYALKLSNRRGDFDRILLQKEKMWIFRIGSLSPVGLNTDCSLQPFLEQ